MAVTKGESSKVSLILYTGVPSAHKKKKQLQKKKRLDKPAR